MVEVQPARGRPDPGGEQHESMLEWLKDVLRPIRREDPDLGSLRYLRDTRTWEGWIDFPPAGYRVEVLLTGSVDGPSDRQRSFLRELEAKYAALVPRLTTMLSEGALESNPAGPPSFKLVAIDLPEDPRTAAWELCFETEPPSEFLVVRLRGFAPEAVTVEC